MVDIPDSAWSETDASNTSSPPNGWPEGQNPSTVNDVARMMMGAIKRWFDWRIPVTTAGTTAAYTVSYSVAPGALVDGMTHRVLFNAANTLSGGETTINFNSLGAKNIRKFDGTNWVALAAGDLVANSVHDFSYHSADSTYRIVSSAAPFTAALLALANTFTNAVTVTGNFTATAGTNSYTGTIGSASTGTTQAQADNTTKMATDAYVDRVAVQQKLSSIDGAVHTGSTQIPLDDTIPQNTEGDQYLSLTITPKSATSKLVIDVVLVASHNLGSANNIIMALFQDSTANALAATYAASSAQFEAATVPLRYVMTSGTTSATTFKVRAGTNLAAVLTVNGVSSARLLGGVSASSITITEIGV